MQNRISYRIARVALFLSIISYYIPTFNPDPFKILYWVGIGLNFIACLLFFIGTRKLLKNLAIGGLIFGLIIWIVSILNYINSIIWGKSQIIEPGYVYFIFMGSGLNAVPQTTLSFYGSIAHIIVTIIELICVITAYIKFKVEHTKSLEELELEYPRTPEIIQEPYEIREYEEEIMHVEDNQNLCPMCQSKIQVESNFCINCGYKLKFCLICKRYIKNEKEIAKCPFCNQEFHKTEFLEWIKIKASCAACEKQIDLWEFQNMYKNNL
ncbi:MAG: hypothetical protein ACFFDN_38260 [Candidatus Hodarchaeota archaeon]